MKYSTTKWTIRAIYHFTDIFVATGEHKRCPTAMFDKKKEPLDYLNIKFAITNSLLL